jgi:hypothetical protein
MDFRLELVQVPVSDVERGVEQVPPRDAAS